MIVGNGRQILTADHVLGRSSETFVRTFDGEILNASIVSRNRDTDLALLEIEPVLPPLRFAGYPMVGSRTCAVGNAFGLGISVTCGTVSAVRRSGVGFNPIEDFIQTDAAVNPGMSGGALVDETGALVGILSAIFTKQSDANIGVNFAVSAPLAEIVFARLQLRTALVWPSAGLRLKAHPDKPLATRLGARIVAVAAGSAAEAAGLVPGAIVVQAGDRRIYGPADLRAAIVLQPAGKPLTLSFLSGPNKEIIIAE